MSASQTMDNDMDVDEPVASTSAQPKEPVPDAQQRAQSLPFHPSNFTVGFVYSAEMTNHYHPTGHYEQPARITNIWEAIVAGDYNRMMKRIPIRPVKRHEVLLAHSEDQWDKVIAIEHMTPQQIVDSEQYYDYLSLYVMQGTTRAACLSCGGAIEAGLAVARGELKKTFAIIRPPGHHAEPDEHMGFCFFNNVAVAARVIQQTTKIKKILILDWDVHHGNGTQKAFKDDDSVLYISLHRYDGGEFYPNGPFGAVNSCGEGPGLGFSVNIPWEGPGMGDAEYIHAFHKIVMPIALEFAPELVIISAGFDAAEGDDLGEYCVTPPGYAHMTHMLSSLAGGRMLVALEGGYNLNAVTNSAMAVLKVLLGEAPDELPSMVANESATETVYQVALEQSKYWKCIDPKAIEPREAVEPITFSISEILKAHRENYLYKTYDMMAVPILGEELARKFSSQIMCTTDLFDNETMVVFVHEFGNLRTQLDSVPRCNVKLEKSYLIDFSKELVGWVKEAGYSLLDINLYPKPFAPLAVSKRPKATPDYTKQIATYLWDNYMQLSEAKNIVLVGHGPGGPAITDLLQNRRTSVMKKVRAIVQVVGHTNNPTTPKFQDDKEFRVWYAERSFVALPAKHKFLGSDTTPKTLRRHGTICPIDESLPIKIIMSALPGIREYVNVALGSVSS